MQAAKLCVSIAKSAIAGLFIFVHRFSKHKLQNWTQSKKHTTKTLLNSRVYVCVFQSGEMKKKQQQWMMVLDDRLRKRLSIFSQYSSSASSTEWNAYKEN